MSALFLKRIIFLFALGCIYACASPKVIQKKCKSSPFVDMDSLEKAKQQLNYKIEIPNDWKKSKFSSGDWYYLKDASVDSLSYPLRKANLYVSKFNFRVACTSTNTYTPKDFLNYYIDYKSAWYKPTSFKYLLLQSKHKTYGDVYILKYKNNISSIEQTTSTFLFFYKNSGFVLEYKNNTNDFDSYLPQVQKIVASFEILLP